MLNLIALEAERAKLNKFPDRSWVLDKYPQYPGELVTVKLIYYYLFFITIGGSRA